MRECVGACVRCRLSDKLQLHSRSRSLFGWIYLVSLSALGYFNADTDDDDDDGDAAAAEKDAVCLLLVQMEKQRSGC